FIYSMVRLTGAGLDVVAAWFAHPLNAVLSIVLVGATFHHAQLGLQVVIEDYVHHEGRKLASIVGIKFLAVLLAAGAIFGILKLAFGVHG
ncbi:MAG TPA: succinate dehydrogenase, hydrophobic membrane anchor protein, partial [Alphaproteobacteria bacterium]